MSVAVVTGSCGLVGSESAAHYASLGYDPVNEYRTKTLCHIKRFEADP